MDLSIQSLADAAPAFGETLAQQKASAEAGDFPWYPYGSLDNFHLLRQLLEQHPQAFADAAPGPVLDIGAADGEVAFFLEAHGLAVDVVDFGPTNYNGCRGIRSLARARGSAVRILETDLDSQFSLPGTQYRLALFLGILYHLKNPYFALEQLAKSAETMLLSTRITRFNRPKAGPVGNDGSNDERVELAGVPAAYLVAPDECNNDATNFWIFTEAGLRRILQRTGWQVLALQTFGAVGASDPASPEGDERAFVYARRAG